MDVFVRKIHFLVSRNVLSTISQRISRKVNLIISHKHKFIFIKPLKVAGTSLEISLAKHCDPNDVITPLTSFSEKSDESAYTHSARNYKKEGYYNHITPAEIKNKVGKKVWNEYFKITVVRNPWDQIVSRYFWELGISKMPLSEKVTLEAVKRAVLSLVTPKSNGIDNGNISPKKADVSSFQKFVRSIDESWTNTRYYFDANDNSVCDYYIAYENLQEDYSKVCNRLGVIPESLPKTKNRQRKTKEHYSVYYNSELRKMVYDLCRSEVEFFKYKFEPE